MTNPFSLPPFIAALFNAALVIWIYRRATPGPVRSIFMIWNTWLACWNGGIAIGYVMPDPAHAYSWYIGECSLVVCYLGPLFLHFAMAVTEWKGRFSQRLLAAAYGWFSVLSLLNATTPLILRAVHHYFWGYYPLAGRCEFIFGLSFAACIGYGVSILWRTMRASRGYRRNQLSYLIAGALVCFGTGSTNFLPLYGVTIYPIGNLLNTVYSLLIAYAIVEFGFMDIRLVLRTGLAYGMWTGALSLVYFSLVTLLKSLAGHYQVEESYAFYTAAMPLTMVLAPAIKARIDPLVQQSGYWSTKKYGDILRDFNPFLINAKDTTSAARRILEQIRKWMSPASGAIYIHDRETGLYCHFDPENRSGEVLTKDHPVIAALTKETSTLVKEKKVWELIRSGHGERHAAVRALRDWPYDLAIALREESELVGVLALGSKQSGELYSRDDLNLLSIIAVSATAVLQNAQTCREVGTPHAKQDMDLVGIFATEIAHELSKPLTRILNAQSRLEAVMDQAADKDLNKIERETRRVSEIIDGFSMLSPGSKLHRIYYPMSELIDEALEVVGLREEQGSIHVKRHYERVPAVWLNPGQIAQVLTNVFQNAVQAMPKGGRMTVTLKSTLSDEQPDRPWVTVEVEDTGEGIPRTILHRVFDLLFTTRGASGGRGIGLAISRAMVQRHGGIMTIDSPLTNEGGTRVTIQLPQQPKEI